MFGQEPFIVRRFAGYRDDAGSPLRPVKDVGYKGFVEAYPGHEREMRALDRELNGGSSNQGSFDEDLYDESTPEPTTHERQHEAEHGEYPSGYYQRHDEAYRKARQRYQEATEPVGHHAQLVNFILNHAQNDALWHKHGRMEDIDHSRHSIYGTQPFVVQRHLDRYLHNRADEVAHVHEYGMTPQSASYPGTHHPMFVRHEGNLYAIEGHHRTASDMLSGRPTHAIVYDADVSGWPPVSDSFPVDHPGLRKYSEKQVVDCDYRHADPEKAAAHALYNHDEGVCAATERKRARERKQQRKKGARRDLEPITLLRTAARDQDFGWHITASWRDVQAKARRIRADGGVHIVIASHDGIGGQVRGDHDVYETLLVYAPGTRKIASWMCGCKWFSFSQDRSPAFQRLQNRKCSHALALQYEAQSQGMFGQEIRPAPRPGWLTKKTPIVTEYDKDTGRNVLVRPYEGALLPLLVGQLRAEDVDPAEVIGGLLRMGMQHVVAVALWKTAEHDVEHRCPHCGGFIGPRALEHGRCPHCGTPLESDHHHEANASRDGRDDRERLKEEDLQRRHRQLKRGLGRTHDAPASSAIHTAELSFHRSKADSVHYAKDEHNEYAVHRDGDWHLTVRPLTETAGVRHALGQPVKDHETFDTLALAKDAAGHYSDLGEDYSGHMNRMTKALTLAYDNEHRQRMGAVKEQPGPTVSGVALKAHDTGRVLMIQRDHADEKDPARGRWEFPGGHHEDGDLTSLHAGVREWQEEVGQPFPEGGVVTHTWTSPNGVYQGHVVVIPSENDLSMQDGRVVPNPDDPKGDRHEQAAWWEVEHARKNPALREETKKGTPWKEIAKASLDVSKTAEVTSHGLSWDKIQRKYPYVYGDEAHNGEDEDNYAGWDPAGAAAFFAFDRPERPSTELEHPGQSDETVHDLNFYETAVHPRGIAYHKHGDDDFRVKYALQGYQSHPESMPPVLLVHRHGVYQVADGHHRAEAGHRANIFIPALVTHSPYPHIPFSDGTSDSPESLHKEISTRGPSGLFEFSGDLTSMAAKDGYWRVHPDDRPFARWEAHSKEWDDGFWDEQTPESADLREGFSSFKHPEDLYRYFASEEHVNNQGEHELSGDRSHVIHFPGTEVGRGHDNERLVMPEGDDDAQESPYHECMSWHDFRNKIIGPKRAEELNRNPHEAAAWDPISNVNPQPGRGISEPLHSNSTNPASTGWATSEDPGDWSNLNTDPGRMTPTLGYDAVLHPHVEPALPSTDGELDPVPDNPLKPDDLVPEQDSDIGLLDGSAMPNMIHASLPESARVAAIVQRFQQTEAAQVLMTGADSGTKDIAVAAQAHLQKTALAEFSHAEQQELINENPDGRARNFPDLDLEHTHYALLQAALDAEGDDATVLFL